MGLLLPFHRTTEPATKLPPFTVKVNGVPPAVALEGVIIVMVGIGFGIELIVNIAGGEDVPPPGAGLETVTAAVLAVAMSLARMAAVSDVGLPKVVTRALPFQFTVEVGTKPVPATLRLNPGLPAAASLGARAEIVGTGLGLGGAGGALAPPPQPLAATTTASSAKKKRKPRPNVVEPLRKNGRRLIVAL